MLTNKLNASAVIVGTWICIAINSILVSCSLRGLSATIDDGIWNSQNGSLAFNKINSTAAVVKTIVETERKLLFTEFNDLSCGILSFSVYNSSIDQWNRLGIAYINNTYRAQMILDQYPAWRVNIRVDVDTSGCPETIIKCARIKIGDTQTTVQTSTPYLLWPQAQHGEPSHGWIQPNGFKTLEAWIYENEQCTGIEFCHEKVDVHVVAVKNPFLTLEQTPISVFYKDALPTSNPDDVWNIEEKTCNFIREAILTKLLPRGSLIVLPGDASAVGCWKTSDWASLSCRRQVTIKYKFYVKFVYRGLSVYSNPDMLTQFELDQFIRRLFRDEIGIGTSNEVMSSYLKRLMRASNPLYRFTRIFVG